MNERDASLSEPFNTPTRGEASEILGRTSERSAEAEPAIRGRVARIVRVVLVRIARSVRTVRGLARGNERRANGLEVGQVLPSEENSPLIPRSLVCLRYLKTDNTPCQCVSDGSLAKRPSRPTGYTRSGRVPSMAYMSEPTAARY